MAIFTSIEHLFKQLKDLVVQLSDEQYKMPCRVLYEASTGQHLRHVIELFTELNKGYDSGTVNYDLRQRNLAIETDREYAMAEMKSVLHQLVKPNKPLELQGDYATEDTMLTSVSTNYYRELIYNFEHTIHHMALIKSGLTEMPGVMVPGDFGVAMSTLKYRQACAQ